jgi:hypothetical protein
MAHPRNYVTVSRNWHTAISVTRGTMMGHRKTMALANRTELEQRGLLPPSPGREEAVAAARQAAAEKRQAIIDAYRNKGSQTRKRK